MIKYGHLNKIFVNNVEFGGGSFQVNIDHFGNCVILAGMLILYFV